ncbi:hypothetical protein EJ05DRAFT_542577 [Pseudovirgaria hyperparasitica]|uniref:C2H2-type domain-containing protein n=1 Tax=Pseudovirgaria hyperparasitica TaxID=470096 RepID=A0A6A6VQP4_9PEZI|nr:uncharacterized protein EJ05DRAFT_542577 [Pseudovirgaria hyperparasitica]KAF2752523.1 hypothetical protein EJ05DRAFT_542577 [Pseudovirgaria hyperparasitica]
MSTFHFSVSGEQFGSSPCQWPENQPSSPYTVSYRNSQLNLDGCSICPSPHVIDDICTEGLGIAVGRSHCQSGATLHRIECSLTQSAANTNSSASSTSGACKSQEVYNVETMWEHYSCNLDMFSKMKVQKQKCSGVITVQPRRQFICSKRVKGVHCGRKFSKLEHLKRHQETHDQERTFTCDIMLRSSDIGHHRKEGPCRQTFLRHDNYLAHFRTHLVQDTRGLFFPRLNNTGLYADLIALVPVLRSGVDTGNMHRYHRNTRVSWENLVERVREAKGALVADQILVTILRACLRHDARVARSFC